jgi:TolA-binding protein
MRNLSGVFFLIFSIALVCCAPDSSEKSIFRDLESAVDADQSKENLNNLLKAYNSYLVENPTDITTYEKAYNLATSQNLPIASSYLIGLIKNSDPGSQKVSEWLYALAESLEKQQKTEASKVIYGNLIKRFPSHPKLSEMQGKVAGSDPLAIIETLTKSRLENPDQYGINRNEAFKFVDACEAYAISDPEDPRSPKFIFDAAEIAKLLKTYNKALGLYDWLVNQYPDYSKTPSALFIKAFTLENELGQLDEAKAAYELFLEKYPDDNFADDARFSLENIGRTPEEVLKSIEAKANQ